MIGEQLVSELDNQLKIVIKISGLMLAGICLALVLHSRDSVLFGMAVGIATGMYNSITLAKRIKRLPNFSPDVAKKYMRKGLSLRLGLIMIVLFFTGNKLPFISLYGVGAGLLVPYAVSILVSMFDSFRLYRQSEAFIKKYYSH